MSGRADRERASNAFTKTRVKARAEADVTSFPSFITGNPSIAPPPQGFFRALSQYPITTQTTAIAPRSPQRWSSCGRRVVWRSFQKLSSVQTATTTLRSATTTNLLQQPLPHPRTRSQRLDSSLSLLSVPSGGGCAIAKEQQKGWTLQSLRRPSRLSQHTRTDFKWYDSIGVEALVVASVADTLRSCTKHTWTSRHLSSHTDG